MIDDAVFIRLENVELNGRDMIMAKLLHDGHLVENLLLYPYF